MGGSNEVIEIGGLDNPVIKHPISGLPYIPGSSLKGKMRSLLELPLGKVTGSGKVHSCKNPDFNCPICRIFGVSGADGSIFGPGRLIVRDANITKIKEQPEWKTDLAQTEIKYENTIDRIKGTAVNPRQMERVPAGAVFDFSMNYRVFSVQKKEDSAPDEGQKDLELFEHILDCFKLLENDTLGGSGSRGYGQISFLGVEVVELDGRTRTEDISSRSVEPAR